MGAFDGIMPPDSTSASKCMEKRSYDVFINHHGGDVKHTLASFLHSLITGMTLSVFLDLEELEYGDFYPHKIEAAMTSAWLHIAIFSKRYAESPWCLSELSFMLKSGAKIIPIFYQVEPTDLRYIDQGTGKYVDAFKKYEQKGRYSQEKLQEWKNALKTVSFYVGEKIKTKKDEARLLKNIGNSLLKVKNSLPSGDAEHPVGQKEIVESFELNTLGSAHGNQAKSSSMVASGENSSDKLSLDEEPQKLSASVMDQELVQKLRTDLPIARKPCQQRFLEKRKDRIMSAAPYSHKGEATSRSLTEECSLQEKEDTECSLQEKEDTETIDFQQSNANFDQQKLNK